MNLVNEKWLPVMMQSGENKKVGLLELFEYCSDIKDLTDLESYEKISIMNFLICLSQYAVDGPDTMDEIYNTEFENHVKEKTIEYLKDNIDKFNIYDENNPFMQIKSIVKEKKDDFIKNMNFKYRTESYLNNFERIDEKINRSGEIDDTKVAIDLLTLFHFDRGGKASCILWDGKKNDESLQQLPNSNYFHFYIKSIDILKSIILNMMSKDEIGKNDDWGLPSWENMPKSINGKDTFKNNHSYLGGLLPVSRCLLINKNEKSYISHTFKLKEEYNQIIPCENVQSIIFKKNKKEVLYPVKLKSDLYELIKEVITINDFHMSKLSNNRKILLGDYSDKYDISFWIGGLELAVHNSKILNIIYKEFKIKKGQFEQLYHLKLTEIIKEIDDVIKLTNNMRQTIKDYTRNDIKTFLFPYGKLDFLDIIKLNEHDFTIEKYKLLLKLSGALLSSFYKHTGRNISNWDQYYNIESKIINHIKKLHKNMKKDLQN